MFFSPEGIRSIIDDFNFQRKARREIAKVVGHISLSFHRDDAPTLTDDRMRELAAAYMECMGIADTQYIVARHNDTEHPHLHIIYNRVKYAGRLWRIRTNAAGTSKSANSLNADTG